MLITYTTVINTWGTIHFEYLNTIIVSGIIGIFLGDTLLFIALQKIGPRRNNILFSLAAPFTVLLNIFFLKKQMSAENLIGCFIVFIGVVIAVAFGSNKKLDHRWETVQGSIIVVIRFGILAALCQAVGLIMMKPILDLGADPIASASIRTSISCLMLSFTFFLRSKNFTSPIPFNLSILFKSIISGFLGMALGMSLLLIALQNADAGIVATLSSTSPIIVLFLIWILTKEKPQKGAFSAFLDSHKIRTYDHFYHAPICEDDNDSYDFNTNIDSAFRLIPGAFPEEDINEIYRVEQDKDSHDLRNPFYTIGNPEYIENKILYEDDIQDMFLKIKLEQPLHHEDDRHLVNDHQYEGTHG
jgi:drug/metabolite transporter (DMT)-like permease